MSGTTGKLTIYGASDDLIEIEGVITEEFGVYLSDTEKHPGWLLAVSDGTLLRVKYGGRWRITPVAKGRAEYRKVFEATDDDDDNYSDRVELEGEFAWVVLCDGEDHQWAKP